MRLSLLTRVLFCALLTMAFTGCDGDKPAPGTKLLPAKPETLSAEAERLAKLQRITVIDTNNGNQPKELTTSEFTPLLNNLCGLDACDEAPGCLQLCQAQTDLCRAETYLAMTRPQAAMVKIDQGYAVPEQSEEAKQTIARLGFDEVSNAAHGYRSVLREMVGLDPTQNQGANTTCGYGQTAVPTAPGLNFGGLAATGFAKTLDVYKKLQDVLIATSVNSADAELNSAISIPLATQRALAQRLAAAKAIGGFADSLPSGAYENGVFCSRPPATSDVQAAIKVFRDAAVSPTDVLSGITTDNLVNGINGAVPGGSVRQRLANFYFGAQDSAMGAMPVLPNGKSVEEQYNLDLATFDEARAYLKEELVAFSRSHVAVLPSRNKPGGSPADYVSYAATAGPPSRLPAAFYGALARAGDEHSDTQGAGDTLSTDYNQLFPAFSATAQSLLAAQTGSANTLDATAFGPLGLVLSPHELLGTVYAARVFNGPNSSSWNVNVYGFSRADGVKLATTVDDLRCAVQGSIEGGSQQAGQPCQLSLISVTDITPPATSPFTTCASGNVPDFTNVYVLKPRDASRVDPAAPQATLPPGSYQALIGFNPHPDPTKLALHTEFAITRGGDERIAAMLEPSRDWCARPHVTCDNSNFDERIPLEDELSDDGNGIENSWKHYLDLASAAATEADTLGTDYINEALSRDQNTIANEDKKEQQLQQANQELLKLQELCGTHIDIELLSSLFPVDSVGNVVGSGDVCSASTPCTDPAFVCRREGALGSGRCVFDVDSFIKQDLTGKADAADVQRLQDCLSGGTIEPFVALGDRPLCLWRERDNHNLVCQVDDGTGKLVPAPRGMCPRVLMAPDPTHPNPTCADTLPTPPETAEVLMSDHLGYYSVAADLTGSDDRDALFELVRNLVPVSTGPAGSEARSDLNKLIASNILEPMRLSRFANGLEYEARPGDCGAITYNGVTLYETGSLAHGVIDGPAAKWPCGSTDAPWKKSYLLDKTDLDCTNTVDRRHANALMLAAVAQAKSFAQTPPESDKENHLVFSCGMKLLTGCTGDILGGQPLLADSGPSFVELDYADGTQFKDEQGHDLGCFGTGQLQWPGPGLVVGGSLRGLYAVGPVPSTYVKTIAPQPGSLGLPSDFDPSMGFLLHYLLGGSAVFTGAASTLNWPLNTYDQPDVSRGNNCVPSYGESGCTFVVGVLDGMNALGLMARAAQTPSSPFSEKPRKIESTEDLGYAAQYVQNVAQLIEASIGGIAFANVPKTVADALRKESASGSYPQFGGDTAVQVSNARNAMLRIRENAPLITNEVRLVGDDIEQLRLIVQKSTIRKQIDHLQFVSTMSQQVANCGSAIAGAVQAVSSLTEQVASAGLSGGAAAASAAITCANSISQIGIAKDLAGLQGQDADLDKQLATIDFDAKFAGHATTLETLGSHLSQAEEDLDAALATLESKRDEARGVLSSAVLSASYQAEAQAQVTNVLGNLATAKQQRYQTALTNAKHMAFLAKRAIEQRLGVRLAEITDNYPLVEAPSHWESTVCEFTGLDYSKLTTPNAPQSFSSGFIGDYVRKLGNFVESYRLQNNFHEGSDTAVISLRDDIMGVRQVCNMDGPNLLFNAGQLAESTQPGWKREDCPSQIVSGISQPRTDCITVGRLVDGNGGPDTPAFADTALSSAGGYNLTFGASATATSAIVQSVDVSPGQYRLTWYTKDTGTDGGAADVTIRGIDASCANADVSNCVAESGLTSPTPSNDWYRHFATFRVDSPKTIRVAFGKPNSGTNATISAPMLEHMSDLPGDEAYLPFNNTSNVLALGEPGCPDSDGTAFRGAHWTHGCVKLCANGFADDCSDADAKDYCYWETSFGLSQRDIQLGKVFNFSGFARGNFNYRIDTIGINFVGTSLHNCADSGAPESCFAGGNIPYTLSHSGPFFVRNFRGEDVEAKVFDGNIEHARGLASERYLTNPLSSADKDLIGQYSRREFSGRPLDGNFVLRVWDENGLDFNMIQDVQIVLNYGYWTKFN